MKPVSARRPAARWDTTGLSRVLPHIQSLIDASRRHIVLQRQIDRALFEHVVLSRDTHALVRVEKRRGPVESVAEMRWQLRAQLMEALTR